MTLNKQKLNRMTESMRVLLTKEQVQAILNRFGAEPEPYEWSEQDIVVQIGNYLYCGEWEKPLMGHGIGESHLVGVDF